MTRPTRQYDLASEGIALLPHQFENSANLQAAIRDLIGYHIRNTSITEGREEITTWDGLLNFDVPSAGTSGYHVAISDDLFVVGDPAGGTGGQAHVWKLISGTWTYQRTIANPRATAGEQFARSVSVSGTTIACGCPYTHLNSGGTVDRGCVDVFVDEGATLEQTIQSDDYGGNADNYGWCVSLCSDRLAVGTPGRHEDTYADGVAYTHTRSEGVWTQEQKISSPKPEVVGAFGRSVALTSDGLAIQQYGYLADGELWVYRMVGGVWTAGTEIGINGCSADGEDTDKVALSGNLLVFHQKDAGNSVEVWWYDGSTWSLKSDIALTSAHHVSVACSALAHLVVIGNSYYGQLKIYSEVEGVCTLVKTVDTPRVGEFGSHCAINDSATKSWIAEGDGGTASGDDVSILGYSVSPEISSVENLLADFEFAIQELETILWHVLEDRWIEPARAYQLDRLRTMIVCSEKDSNTWLQQAWIRLQIDVNCSLGEQERLIDLVERWLAPDFVQYECRNPKVAYFYVENPHKTYLVSRIQPAAEAGVRLVIVSYIGSGTPFGFGYDRDAAGDPCGEELTVGGWGETTETVGGEYPELLTT